MLPYYHQLFGLIILCAFTFQLSFQAYYTRHNVNSTAPSQHVSRKTLRDPTHHLKSFYVYQRNSSHYHLFLKGSFSYLLCERNLSVVPVKAETSTALYLPGNLFLINGTYHSFNCVYSPTAKIAVVSYIYNESDILPYWLEYHTKIFGIDRVAIIDNNSPMETQQILNKWKEKGLTVIHSTEEYALKGNTTFKTFKKYFPEVDFAVPLDADEFIIALDEDGSPVTSKTKILKAFQSILLKYHYTNFRYRRVLLNCNRNPDETLLDIHSFQDAPPLHRKRFFRTFELHGLDHGNHLGYWSGHSNQSWHLGILHYHNRNLDLKLQHAVQDLNSFHYMEFANNNNNNQSMEEQQQQLSLQDRPFLNATSLNKTFLHEMVESHGKGFHKAQEVLDYLQYGREGLMDKCDPERAIDIPYVKEMIAKLTLPEMEETEAIKKVPVVANTTLEKG
jgi:hypothetical protein